MTGPCLCGDPACGRCFPQVRVKCPACGWTGNASECDTFCDAVTGESYCETACPRCEVACEEVEEPEPLSIDGSCYDENEIRIPYGNSEEE